MDTLNKVFEALANPHRRSIVFELSLRPHSISQLAEKESLSLPAIHKHIKVLGEAELVMRRKSGRTNFLALHKGSLISAQKWMLQFNAHWGNQEESLDNYLANLRTS